MFNTISWQEFLSAITVIAGGYYIVTALLLYGNEITNIFRQKEPKLIATKISADQNDSNESIDLMGGIKYESEVNVPHENVVESNEVSVQQPSAPDEPIESRDFLSDAFEELKNEIRIIADGLSSESKDESTLLFKSLVLRYPQLVQTQYEEKIIQFINDLIKEKQAFHLTPNEIKSWLSEAEISTDNHQ
jgi:hypothetical protein